VALGLSCAFGKGDMDICVNLKKVNAENNVGERNAKERERAATAKHQYTEQDF
jgi:hypothetical protein